MIDIRRATEIVGIVAVILSLVFLAYEQKRENDIAESEAIASVMGEINGLVLMLASDDEMGRVWFKGMYDFGSLSEDEIRQYRQMFNYTINAYEVVTVYIENGLVDENFADYFADDLCALIEANDGTKDVWESMGQYRAPSLVSFVDTHCPQLSSK